MYKRQAEDVGVDRPNKNEILHHIPPTPEQEDFIQKPVSYTHLDVYKRQVPAPSSVCAASNASAMSCFAANAATDSLKSTACLMNVPSTRTPRHRRS